MATLEELAGLRDAAGWNELVAKIKVALVVKAVSVVSGTPSAEALVWAKSTLSNPHGMARQVVYFVIASNDTATTAQILNATDTAIQTNVDTAVDNLMSK